MEQNLQWYSTNPITSTPISQASVPNMNWTPPSRVSKRAMSDSDNDDIYSEESSKEQSSSIENDSCQLMSRKKRRGVIEKKRRDRINASLSELKRLVPTAYEKQGSAKLEKAEILQMTVEHLKLLNSKGIDSLSFDPQRFAMEYHIIGFRECASEVARYLVTIEGMDIQDPMRLRLMSHLQCFVSQRELSAKSSVNTNWCNMQNPYPSTYATHSSNQNQQHASPHNYNTSSSSSSSYMLSAGTAYPNYIPHYSSSEYLSAEQVPNASNTASNDPNNSTTTTSRGVNPQQEQVPPIYTELTSINDKVHFDYNNPNQAFVNNPNNNNNNNGYNNVKPYRPWHPDTLQAY